MAEILERVLRLPVGSRILTMDPFFGHGEPGLEAIFINGALDLAFQGPLSLPDAR